MLAVAGVDVDCLPRTKLGSKPARIPAPVEVIDEIPAAFTVHIATMVAGAVTLAAARRRPARHGQDQADASVMVSDAIATVPVATIDAEKLTSPEPTPAVICAMPVVVPVSVVAIRQNVGVPVAFADASDVIAEAVRTPDAGAPAIGFDIAHDASRVPAGAVIGVAGIAPDQT
jgi:hypothetical protein